MKILIIFIIVAAFTKAQWILLDPSPTNYNLKGVQLVSSTLGYAVGDSGTIIKTTDGGTTWDLLSSGTTNDLMSLSFTDENTGTVVGSSGTILRTTNGGMNWKQQTDSENVYLAHTNLWCISFIDSNNGVSGGNYFYGFDAGDDIIFRTTNGGENWVLSNWGHGAVINDISYLDSTNAIAIVDPWGYSTGWKILKSNNGGETWDAVDTLSGLRKFNFIDKNNGLVVGYNGKILKTTNGGTIWTIQTSGTTEGLFSVSFTDSNNGTAVGEAGTIIRTTNGGTDWSTQLSSTTKKLLSVSFIDGNNGVAVGEDGIILRTINAGVPAELTSFNSSTYGNSIQLNWQTASETNNKGFEVYRNGSKISFVNGKGTTTEKQNYSFLDKNLQAGIYNYRLNQIDFDGTQKIVGELTVNLILPEKFYLEQNYPNPFNPTTKIRYTIPSVIASETKQSQLVTLKVYDVLGNEVATLVNEEKSAGSYEVNFSASELPSGIYLYRLQSGNFVEMKKLMLLK